MPTKLQVPQIDSILEEHQRTFKATFVPENLRLLEQIADEMAGAFQRGNKILLCGNGGSAADAQHIAAEFIGRFKRERKSLPAIALTTDSSVLTALANDYSYETVFSRQIEGLGARGDVLIAISTSGNSKNVIAAAKKAKELGLTVIGFTGRSGGELKKHTDFNFSVHSDKTPHIQEMHTTALHAVSEAVEHILFPA
ncbi:MAG TPA: D-sedoheptulose 7-phosphate isomerase [Candidatus Omnitrophota bacterium]|nr:D-sedoheptulose 7-phosphate isomerase [Candidatus Omnitrophota bacterium]